MQVYTLGALYTLGVQDGMHTLLFYYVIIVFIVIMGIIKEIESFHVWHMLAIFIKCVIDTFYCPILIVPRFECRALIVALPRIVS